MAVVLTFLCANVSCLSGCHITLDSWSISDLKLGYNHQAVPMRGDKTKMDSMLPMI